MGIMLYLDLLFIIFGAEENKAADLQLIPSTVIEYFGEKSVLGIFRELKVTNTIP